MNHSRSTMTWTYQGQEFLVPYERKGAGSRVLLLPALSSISTLDEMASLRDRLAEWHETVVVDWPGFGSADRRFFAWTPVALKAYLDDVLDRISPQPCATIAAGHAAGYLIDAAMRRPGKTGRLVLIAPTWRGPLPTMMGRPSSFGTTLAKVGDVPGLGQMLYRLNVNRPMVKFMAREHVYETPGWLDEERLAAKMAITASRGSRHAALRFVTGQLDPMTTRTEFLAAVGAVRDPILVIYGVNSPKKSKAEMEALATLPNVETLVLLKGKLALHEEEPEAVFDAVRPFLEQP